jgi:hypothetical protein
MKNEHLLPVNIIDLVNKFRDPNIRENEKLNYQLRLETIRNYCDESLKKPVVTVFKKK